MKQKKAFTDCIVDMGLSFIMFLAIGMLVMAGFMMFGKDSSFFLYVENAMILLFSIGIITAIIAVAVFIRHQREQWTE